jgi:CheY-like chemotaxis protein
VSIRRAILIVDDEFGFPEMLRDMLQECGYDVASRSMAAARSMSCKNAAWIS